MNDYQNWAPKARRRGLLGRGVADELLVYDLERHRAFCLNRAAALVWKCCDGRRGVRDFGPALGAELGEPVGEEVVQLALEQLGREGLLEGGVSRPEGAPTIPRRELMRRLGLAAASLPLVVSVVAPTTAQAASCKNPGEACNSPLECCSGLCPSGTCS